MKKSVMQKWVKALRSGKYKQANGTLYNKNQDSYCCLGVLCSIYPKIKTVVGDNLYEYQDVINWSGLKDGTELVEFKNKIKTLPKERRDLGALNDELKWSFKKIASFIERNYKEL